MKWKTWTVGWDSHSPRDPFYKHEVEERYADMGEDKRERMQKAFSASPEELGKAAVEQAKKPSR